MMDKREYCDAKNPKKLDKNGAEIYRLDNGLSCYWYLETGVSDDFATSMALRIFHCPMCGRKLEAE